MKKIFFLFVAFLFIESKTIAQTPGVPWISPSVDNLTLPDNWNLGINFPFSYMGTLSAKLHLQNNTVGKGYEVASSSKGLLLENTTITNTNTTTQSSPAIVLIGHGLKPAITNVEPNIPATDKLLDFKIDVSNTSTPFSGGTQVLWGNDYAAFRIQKRSAPTDIYSDFFSVTTKIDAVADLSLRLGQSKIISNSGGANMIHGNGTLAFYNQVGNASYARLTTEGTNAGNFAIGPNVGGTNSPIQSSAILQLESTNKGFLMPRVSGLNSIASPAEGLMVYDKSTDAKSPYYYDGTKWNRVSDASGNPNVMYVSPLQFGAKFDGIHDDILALDATYDYCRTLPYNKMVVIQMPPGVCKISRPWIIGAKLDIDPLRPPSTNAAYTWYRNESDCFGDVPFDNVQHSRPVSIEGSGATALYLDYADATTTQRAGIYYAARGSDVYSLELFNYHISGIGFYGKDYFIKLPAGPNPTYVLPARVNDGYAAVSNKSIGVLVLFMQHFTIENCTFRDLREGIVLNGATNSTVRNCHFVSCRRGYYSRGAHASILEGLSAGRVERAYEIRSGSVVGTNLGTSECPASLWVGLGGATTFNGCYFECKNSAVDGVAQVTIGDDPGDDYYFNNTRGINGLVDGVNFNSLTIVAQKPNSDVFGLGIWMKATAHRVFINGGFMTSALHKLTSPDVIAVPPSNGHPEDPNVMADNLLAIKGVYGTFTDFKPNSFPHVPTGNIGLDGKTYIQDVNASFKTIKFPDMAIFRADDDSVPVPNCFRPLCLDKDGKVVLCPSTGTTDVPVQAICVPSL